MMDADKACKIVDGWEPPPRFEVKGQPFEAQSRQVARTLHQALAEAQAERDAAKRETWANISSTQIWMDLEAERDALRRKLDAAIVAFRRLASPEAFDVSRIATTEERKRMFFAEQALVTLESDPT